MRFLLTLIGCSMTIVCLAQAPSQSVKIQISYEKAGSYLEQAIETIEAVNAVGRGTTVDYQAGRSISLLPGFVARNGSTFTANIRPINNTSELSLKLSAYPNPFDLSTLIEYTLPESGVINLLVINEQGQVIERLLENINQSAGAHQFEWKPKTLSTGTYIPVLRTERQVISKRILKK